MGKGHLCWGPCSTVMDGLARLRAVLRSFSAKTFLSRCCASSMACFRCHSCTVLGLGDPPLLRDFFVWRSLNHLMVFSVRFVCAQRLDFNCGPRKWGRIEWITQVRSKRHQITKSMAIPELTLFAWFSREHICRNWIFTPHLWETHNMSWLIPKILALRV